MAVLLQRGAHAHEVNDQGLQAVEAPPAPQPNAQSTTAGKGTEVFLGFKALTLNAREFVTVNGYESPQSIYGLQTIVDTRSAFSTESKRFIERAGLMSQSVPCEMLYCVANGQLV